MTDRRDLSAFARAVEALEPYLKDLVFVGGWAHYLYTLRPEAGPVPFEPLRTEDADVAAPARLARGNEGIPELLTKAGFREHLSSDHTPPISEYVLGDDAGGFYLEFLAPLVGGEVKRGGRPDVTTTVGGVTAQTLRYLDILLTEPWQVTLTRDAGFPVARPGPEPGFVKKHEPPGLPRTASEGERGGSFGRARGLCIGRGDLAAAALGVGFARGAELWRGAGASGGAGRRSGQRERAERGRSRSLRAADARVHAQRVGPAWEDHPACARAPLDPGLAITCKEAAQASERFDARPLVAAGHARARLAARLGAPG